MTELPTIHQVLALAKKAVGNVKKEQRNTQQGFNFRGIDDVVNAASGPLNEHGVITTPHVESYTYETVEVGRNKTPMAHILGEVTYTFTGPAGDSVKSRVLAESMDSGDKGAAKFMSVAYRIALLQTLNLPTDAPDPDLDSYERSAKEALAPAVEARGGLHLGGAKAGNGKAPKAAEAVSDVQVEELRKLIAEAPDADSLNALWKKAGALGALMTNVDGKTIQQHLYDRNDAIKSGDGNPGAEGRKAPAKV